MVMKGIEIAIAILFLYVKDGGSLKFEVTPGGGFKAGVGVGVAILPILVEAFLMRSYQSYKGKFSDGVIDIEMQVYYRKASAYVR